MIQHTHPAGRRHRGQRPQTEGTYIAWVEDAGGSRWAFDCGRECRSFDEADRLIRSNLDTIYLPKLAAIQHKTADGGEVHVWTVDVEFGALCVPWRGPTKYYPRGQIFGEAVLFLLGLCVLLGGLIWLFGWLAGKP